MTIYYVPIAALKPLSISDLQTTREIAKSNFNITGLLQYKELSEACERELRKRLDSMIEEH